MNMKVGPSVASMLTFVTLLVWGCSLASAVSDVDLKKVLSADAAVEINGGHIHYLGE